MRSRGVKQARSRSPEADRKALRRSAGRSLGGLSADHILTEDQFCVRVIAMREEFRRHRSLVDGAIVCEEILDLFNRYVATKDHVVVTPAEGEMIGGYHPESLTRMVRQGQLPDIRPSGSRGRIYIPLALLPCKPGHKHPDLAKIKSLAKRVYGGAGGARDGRGQASM